MASILDKKGIGVTSGFKYISKNPLDARFVVEDEEELQSIITSGGAYEGLEVWVKSKAKKYMYNGTDFVEREISSGSSEDVTLVEDMLESIQEKLDNLTNDGISYYSDYLTTDELTYLSDKFSKNISLKTRFKDVIELVYLKPVGVAFDGILYEPIFVGMQGYEMTVTIFIELVQIDEEILKTRFVLMTSERVANMPTQFEALGNLVSGVANEITIPEDLLIKFKLLILGSFVPFTFWYNQGGNRTLATTQLVGYKEDQWETSVEYVYHKATLEDGTEVLFTFNLINNVVTMEKVTTVQTIELDEESTLNILAFVTDPTIKIGFSENILNKLKKNAQLGILTNLIVNDTGVALLLTSSAIIEDSLIFNSKLFSEEIVLNLSKNILVLSPLSKQLHKISIYDRDWGDSLLNGNYLTLEYPNILNEIKLYLTEGVLVTLQINTSNGLHTCPIVWNDGYNFVFELAKVNENNIKKEYIKVDRTTGVLTPMTIE